MTKKELQKLASAQQAALVANERESKRKIRELEKAERAADAKKRTEETRHMKLKCLYSSTIRGIIETVRERGAKAITNREVKYWGRNIGTNIYDFSGIWSGYVSVELKRQIDAGEKPKRCPEHFFPRQFAGETIINHILGRGHGSISFDKFAALTTEFCRVHYTTSEENIKLKPFQNSEVFEGPEAAYKAAGIELIKIKDVDDC